MRSINTLKHIPLRIASKLFPRSVADAFHVQYYYSNERTWGNTFYKGVPICKPPTDMQIYHELIWQLKPNVIIETGTSHGGSALFFADQLDMIGKGHVITIDVQSPHRKPQHKRITYLQGSSISEDIQNTIKARIAHEDKIMVVLDSDHSKSHVARELGQFASIVTIGSYLVVEDTNVGRLVLPTHDSPADAVEEFLASNPDFEIDRTREKFFLTFNTWLRKKGCVMSNSRNISVADDEYDI